MHSGTVCSGYYVTATDQVFTFSELFVFMLSLESYGDGLVAPGDLLRQFAAFLNMHTGWSVRSWRFGTSLIQHSCASCTY